MTAKKQFIFRKAQIKDIKIVKEMIQVWMNIITYAIKIKFNRLYSEYIIYIF